VDSVDWKIEVIVVPVSDVERSKAFYSEQVGFVVDVDQQVNENLRVVQMTPPGSACSVTIGTGMNPSPPGTLKGMQLVVPDVARARQELADRGVDVSPVRQMTDAGWIDGHGGPFNAFIFFDDPDGNSWAVQEKPTDG
jgi:catechol 2,3-dioxygenase-like lactoylglutathione lyase family enzyme